MSHLFQSLVVLSVIIELIGSLIRRWHNDQISNNTRLHILQQKQTTGSSVSRPKC